MSDHITLAGQHFTRLKHGPMAHDIWMMNQLSGAGLADLAIGPEETTEAFVDRLLHQLMSSGRVLSILAGLLLPASLDAGDWTPATAEQIAADLARVTDPAEKTLIRQLVIQVLIEFFLNGLATSKTSPSSSKPLAPSAQTAAQPVAPSIMATGTASSAPSALATTTARAPSCAGRFVKCWRAIWRRFAARP